MPFTGLHQRTHPATLQVLRPYCEPCSSLTCAVTYDAADLIWLDGLDELRGLLADASVAAPFDKTVAPAWRCGCLAEMDWYYKWKQWSEDKELDGKMMPLVRTYDLLTDIGMSCDEAKAARVPVAKLPTLCSMVLPDFQAAIVQSLADQLPGIGSNVEPNQKAWLTGVKPCSAPDSMLT